MNITAKVYSTGDVLRLLKIDVSQFEGMLRKRTSLDFDLKETGVGRGKARGHSIDFMPGYWGYLLEKTRKRKFYH